MLDASHYPVERPPASIIALKAAPHKNLSRLPRPMAALTLEPAFLIQHLVSVSCGSGF